MSWSSTRAALAGALFVLLVPPSVAGAQSAAPTAIAPFEGRRARPLERAVRQVLDDDADLVDDDAAREAAERAGVAGTGADGVPAMASELGAELIVLGEVSGPNRAPRVELVFRAADGEELARGEARYRRGRRARRTFARAVRRLYEGATAALDAHRAAARAAEPIEAPPVEEEVVPEEPPPAEVPDDGLALFNVGIGLSVRTREAIIDLENGRQRRYEVATGAYPEIALAAEARPFANDAHLGRGLFVRASFGHSVGLGSESEDGSVQVSTNFVRVALDAGWLAPIGEVVELGLGLGLGYDGYFLSANPVLPSAEYVSVRPAVRGRFRLAQETAVLELEAAYRGVAGIGDIRPAFGADGDAHGFDIGVGIGGNLHQIAGLGFSWSLRFDYVGYVMSFDGAATDTPGTNGTENAVLVTALIGWSFR